MGRKLIYIASPYAGDIEANTAFARQACRYCMQLGNTPFAPHLHYTQLVDDNDPWERQAGLACGLHALEHCDELWVCGERISTGMQGEIERAKQLGIPIRYISTEMILNNRPFFEHAQRGDEAVGIQEQFSLTEGQLVDGIFEMTVNTMWIAADKQEDERKLLVDYFRDHIRGLYKMPVKEVIEPEVRLALAREVIRDFWKTHESDYDGPVNRAGEILASQEKRALTGTKLGDRLRSLVMQVNADPAFRPLPRALREDGSYCWNLSPCVNTSDFLCQYHDWKPQEHAVYHIYDMALVETGSEPDFAVYRDNGDCWQKTGEVEIYRLWEQGDDAVRKAIQKLKEAQDSPEVRQEQLM